MFRIAPAQPKASLVGVPNNSIISVASLGISSGNEEHNSGLSKNVFRYTVSLSNLPIDMTRDLLYKELEIFIKKSIADEKVEASILFKIDQFIQGNSR